MQNQLGGVYAAAVTPLHPNQTPDLNGLADLLNFLARRGCHGILLLGTTGEGPSFSPDERDLILRQGQEVRQGYPGLRLLAGSGTPSLDESIHLTRLAFDLGYDGVVVLPPYYYRMVSSEGLYGYFHQLIQRAVPVNGSLFWYHIPSLTGISLPLDLLMRLKENHPRQFAGIKDSSHEREFARQLGECFGDELIVLNGTDTLFHYSLKNNASGCITAPANLISMELRAMWDGFHRGEDVSQMDAKITKVRSILEKVLPFPPILKALLARKHGLPRWPVRAPLEEVGDHILEEVWKDIEGYL